MTTSTWTATGAAAWSDPANWTNDVAVTSDTALFDVSGSPQTLTVTGDG